MMCQRYSVTSFESEMHSIERRKWYGRILYVCLLASIVYLAVQLITTRMERDHYKESYHESLRKNFIMASALPR